ncbi:MAG: amino acid adenylation domain-containing protein [Pirellulaceae bacterium]|nr:amino acid adenylation domain-containing protein [Pirellulaceae bacterium]
MSSQSALNALSATQQREMLAKLLRAKVAGAQRFPMSIGQQGLWHAFRRDPESTSFNVFLPTRMRAHLDTGALQRAVECVAARHDCLHSVFSDSGGELMLEVQPDLLPAFEVIDLESVGERQEGEGGAGAKEGVNEGVKEWGKEWRKELPTTERRATFGEQQVRAAVARATLAPFDLQRGPLFRVQVYRLAEDDWIVLAMTHHIVVDFWSLVIIVDEMRAAYPCFAQQRAPQLPPPENNFAQFVRDQQLLLASPRGDELRDYWQKTVARATSVLDLPSDRLRPIVFENAARSAPLEFPASTASNIVKLAAQSKATPFSVVHAALQVFLGRMSGQTSFLIGSPFSGRSKGEYERTVGFFINMLPLLADLGGDPTFAQLIVRTSENLLDALEHEAYPIVQITHDAKVSRDPSRSPLFQVSCTFEKSQLKSEVGRASFLFPDQQQVWDFGGLPQEGFYVPHPTCHYDLEFIFEQTETHLRGMIVACRALFEEASVRAMAQNFSQLLQRLLGDSQRPLSQVSWGEPDVVSLAACSSTDAAEQGHGARSTTSQASTVDRMLFAATSSNPSGVAFQFAGRQISYTELWHSATRLAKRIEHCYPEKRANSRDAANRESRSILPIYTESGPLAFIGMLAAHLTGAASAAIDARQPAVELQTLCTELNARCWLGDSSSNSTQDTMPIDLAESLGEVDADVGKPSAPEATRATDAAYLIYTSGSTGRPKGVLVEHAAVCNTLHWRQKAVPLFPSDRVFMLLSHQFDAALGIGWTTLTQGATLVWPDSVGKVDPESLLEQIIRDRITVLPAVPSLLRVLVAHRLFAQCDSLRLIFTGGEPLPPELPSQVRQISQAKFWNFYGPSEAAIEATACEVTDHSPQLPVPIGRPIDNMQVLVLDAERQPVPVTVPGELAIAGVGLARGYWNGTELDAELTAQKFVSVNGLRVYLTGDRGRRLPDGQLQFLGRDDHQIKLRGYRIELGEIEAVLESHPQVERAAVKLVGGGLPQAQLLGFVSLLPNARDSDEMPVEQAAVQSATLSAGLRRFVSGRLPSYKVPTAIVIVDPMPLTSSGKVDRRRLPDTLPETLADEHFIAAETPLEEYLAAAWCESLRVERVSVDRNYFDAGGSSLQAAMLTTQLSQDLGVYVPTALLFDLVDIAHMALRLAELHSAELSARFGGDCLMRQISRMNALAANGTQRMEIESHVEGAEVDGPNPRATAPLLSSRSARLHPLLAPLKVSGSRTPIFMVHPPGGIVVCYRELARQLAADQPLLALRSRGLHGAEPLPPTLAAMAADYVEAVRAYQPQGPYTLGGWSLGGLVAYEMAQQLLHAGQELSHLILLDTTIPAGATELVPASELVNVGLEYGIELTLDELGALAPEEQLRFLWEHAQGLGVLDDNSPPEVVARVLQDLQQLFHHHVQLSRAYRIQPLNGRIELIRPSDTPVALPVAHDRGWSHLARSVRVQFVSGHHHSMVQSPHVEQLAQIINSF